MAASQPWVELRVHGVSGTPPEELLDRPHVRQVDGDDKSRFFRAVRGDGTVEDSDDHVVEAFHWGRYTSGSWKQSFWLALLPFGMVNLAAFMLPPAPSRKATSAATVRRALRLRVAALGILRFIGILMTMLLALAVSLTLIEVVSLRWLRLRDWAPHVLLAWATPLATVLSGAAIAVLGGRSWFATVVRRARPLDEKPLPATPVRGPVGPIRHPGAKTPLGRENFYTGDADTLVLRGLHLAAGMAVPAYLSLSLGDSALSAWCAWFLLWVTVLAALVGDRDTTGLTSATRKVVRAWHRVVGVLTALSVGVATVFLLVGAAAVVDLRTERIFTRGSDATTSYIRVPEAHTDTFDWSWRTLLDAAGVALILLVLVVALLARVSRARRTASPAAPYFRRYTRGLAAIPMAALALFLGVGYSAALVEGSATVLGSRDEELQRLAGTTSMLERVSYAFALSLVPLVVFGVVLLVIRLGSQRHLLTRAFRDLPEDAPYPRTRLVDWREDLAGALWTARAKNAVPALIWVLALTGFVLFGGVLAEIQPPPHYRSVGWLSGTSGPLVEIGTWVLVALIAALVSLARGAFRDAGLRRTVNIIWDVVAFWPHAVHPFIPTPYSLRTVIDLVARIRHHLDETPEGRQVLVCGHSQGSLISFAALQLLEDHELRRVGLLTFGSQLRVIFPKAFPAYVNVGSITDLRGRLDRAWINLYRDTDPLAGPVLSWDHRWSKHPATARWFDHEDVAGEGTTVGRHGTVGYGDDWRLVDPVPRVDPLQAGPINQIYGHGWFWTHPDWRPALDELRSRGAEPGGALVGEDLPGELQPGGDGQHHRDDHHHQGRAPHDVAGKVPGPRQVVERADQPT